MPDLKMDGPSSTMLTMEMYWADGSIERIEVPRFPDTRRIIAERKREFPPGTRVFLRGLCQTPNGYDDSVNLPPGSIGTVSAEPDDAGSLPIKWDHGASLQATAHDRIEVLDWDTSDPT